MKRWAFVTVFLYGAFLLLLTVPIMMVAFPEESSVKQIFFIYHEWLYWAWIGIMVLSQALLLIVPIDLSQRKDVSRRKLIIPVITSALLMAVVLMSGIFTIGELAKGDDVPGEGYHIIIFSLLLWVTWSVIFWRFREEGEGENTMNRLTKWLIRGSILELLVAVPSHVIVREREYCCAGFITFWGIVTGVSVMLLAFGPAVFFLFSKRFGCLNPTKESDTTAIENESD